MNRIEISGEKIFSVLGGRKTGNAKWRCFCPSHDDGARPSLSVTDTGDRVLWHCFSGCTNDEVKSALVDAGLFPEPGRSRPQQEFLSKDEIEYMELYVNLFKADNTRGKGHPSHEIETYKKYKSILGKTNAFGNSARASAAGGH